MKDIYIHDSYIYIYIHVFIVVREMVEGRRGPSERWTAEKRRHRDRGHVKIELPTQARQCQRQLIIRDRTLSILGNTLFLFLPSFFIFILLLIYWVYCKKSSHVFRIGSDGPYILSNLFHYIFASVCHDAILS